MSQPQSHRTIRFSERQRRRPARAGPDCGDFADHCASGFTFFRRDTQVRSTADQLDSSHEWIYLVYDATKPAPTFDRRRPTARSEPGRAGQAATFFVRYDGAWHDRPGGDRQPGAGPGVPGHLRGRRRAHALWWDSRIDRCYSVTRRSVTARTDDGAVARRLCPKSTDRGATWTETHVTDAMTNPNYEQFDNRALPFAGDYLWVTSLGDFAYGAWTDWRNTVQGADPRETPEDDDAGTADVKQCRVTLPPTDKKGNTIKSWSGDRCPHVGGLDQNIYGDKAP